MKNYNKNNIKFYILLVTILIICIIFVDLIFNFSSLLMNNYEKFQTFDKRVLDRAAIRWKKPPSSSSDSNTPIESIISKMNGKIFNIYILSDNEDPTEPKIIQIPTSQVNNLTINENGTFSETPKSNSNQNQNWMLVRVESSEDYEDLLTYKHNTGNYDGNSINDINYPIYDLLSQSYFFNEPWGLNYNDGILSARPIGNYKSQHWDVSYMKLPKNNFYTYDPSKSYNTRFGRLQEPGMTDPNKIKINFNIKDKNLASLLSGLKDNGSSDATHVDESTESGKTTNNKCDKYVNKDAISSVCGGCDLSKVHLNE